MNKFNKGGDRKFGGDFKKRGFRDRGESDRGARGGFGRDRGDRPEMFKAVCAECGDSCEVPFKPNGNKPVYCSNCFKRDKAPSNNFHSDRAPRFEAPHFHAEKSPVNSKLEDKLDAINAKLEKIMKFISPAVEAIKEIDFDTPEEIIENVKGGIDKIKAGAKNVKREAKTINKETKELRSELLKDAKAIKKEVVRNAKSIGKTIAKDVKKVKKEVGRVVKNVKARKKKK